MGLIRYSDLEVQARRIKRLTGHNPLGDSAYAELFNKVHVDEFIQVLSYVDFDGNTHQLKKSEDDWHKLYVQGIREEAKKYAKSSYDKRKNKIKELELSDPDWKSISKWVAITKGTYERNDGLPLYYELTKRARKFSIWTKETLLNDFSNLFNSYLLLAPHTFCFSPQVPSDLEKRMSNHFLKRINDYETRGDWIRSPLLFVENTQNYFAGFKMYASYNNRIKLKMYSWHTKNGLKDILDVEAQFRGGKFEDIVHYHVEKPLTLNLLSGPSYKGSENFEMSGNPRTGKVTMIESRELEGEKRTSTEIPQAKKSIVAMKYWGEHPVIAGGNLLKRGIEIIEQEGRYETLVGLARQKVNRG